MNDASNEHVCPAGGCDKMIPNTLVFCRPHWYMVSPPLRNKIWASYHAGHAGKAQHLALIVEATNEVNAKRKP